MKHVKMLALTAIAAGALIALGGAGSAAATTLCGAAPNGSGVCDPGQVKEAGTVVEAKLEATAETIFRGWTETKCAKSSLKATTVNKGGATFRVKSNVEALTFEECKCDNSATVNADVTVLSKGEFEFSAKADNGTGVWYGQNQVVTINCKSLGQQCKYGTPATGLTLGSVTGGGPARLLTNVKLNFVSGDGMVIQCGSTATWETAGYEVTAPNPLFLGTS